MWHVTITVSVSLPATALYVLWHAIRSKSKDKDQ